VVSVDRMERGQNGRTAVQELFEEFGIPTFSIVTVKEMLPYLNTDQGRRIREYLNRYCGE
jgi:orotate phosphoribosyltransferase